MFSGFEFPLLGDMFSFKQYYKYLKAAKAKMNANSSSNKMAQTTAALLPRGGHRGDGAGRPALKAPRACALPLLPERWETKRSPQELDK